MISPAQALTRQFYGWERRGRGWLIHDEPVELEPGFAPFPGHFVEQPIIDDGRRPHWLAGLFSPSAPQPPAGEAKEEPLAYLDESDEDLTIYTVALQGNARHPLAHAEQLLVMLSYRSSPVSFELIGTADAISLQWCCRDADAEFLHAQLRAYFPEVRVAETYEDMIFELIAGEPAMCAVDFGLQEEFMRPMAAPAESPDPHTALFGVLERLEGDQAVIVQVLFCGAINPWADSVMAAVRDGGGRDSFFLDDPDMPRLAAEKTSRPLYGATVRALAMGEGLRDARRLLQHAATALVHASASPFNRLAPLPDSPDDPLYPMGHRLADMVLRQSRRPGMLLNSRELATLVHFPGGGIASRKLGGARRATSPAPGIALGHPYVLGTNVHDGTARPVGISTEQRLRHVHIMGATGTGKSTLLKGLVVQDILAGQGLMCLDPHGDLIEDILEHVPEHRIKDVVLIDPSDAEFPVGLNVLRAHSDVERELLASDLVALFRRFSTSWGDQMNSVLANAILACLYNEKSLHLGELRRFLIEPPFRAAVLSSVTDPHVAYYWRHEFPLLRGGSVASILTRLDAFLRPKSIRSMVCQHGGIDLAQLMDTNKIVLVKLSQGLMGAENSFLLGAFIVSKLQQTAMSRQAQGIRDRVPFFCYVDEFQNFATPSMAAILSGARKYGLGLVLSHQDMQQVSRLDAEIAGSVLANAGTRVCFRLGDADARRMEDGFAHFSAGDLQNLEVGEAVMRVNTTQADCSLEVEPLALDGRCPFRDAIRDHSRSMYSVLVAPPAPGRPEPEPPPPAPPAREASRAAEGPARPAAKEAEREHRFLQMYIKKLAESHGYRAQMEAPLPGSAGLVDVVLERDGSAVAVEISVTTSAKWELHNVRKCLAAGFARIVVCAGSPGKRKAIEASVGAALSEQERAKITVIAPDDIPALLAPAHAHAPRQATHKGYRVKVNYEEGPDRQDLVQRILNLTRKPN